MGFNKNTWQHDLSHKPGLKGLVAQDLAKKAEAAKREEEAKKGGK